MRANERIRQMRETLARCKHQAERERSCRVRRNRPDSKEKRERWARDAAKREKSWKERQSYYAARAVNLATVLDCEEGP